MEAGFEMDGFAYFLMSQPVASMARNDRFRSSRSRLCEREQSWARPTRAPVGFTLGEKQISVVFWVLGELGLLGAGKRFPACVAIT